MATSWEDVPLEGRVVENGISLHYDYMSYQWIYDKTTKHSENFIKMIAAIQDLVMKETAASYGLAGDVNPDKVQLYYWDPEVPCSEVWIRYPA